MWPFKASNGVSELSAEVETLKRDMRNLRLDWETTYEKIRTLMARLAKRAELRDTPADQGTEGESVADSAGSPLSPAFARLTPRQRQIQIQIMHRRGNGGT